MPYVRNLMIIRAIAYTLFAALLCADCVPLTARSISHGEESVGFHHVDAHPMNQCIQILHGMKRIPIDDLQSIYLDPEPKHDEAQGRTPRPHGHAIAFVPLRPTTKAPYVLVYLHGFNHQIVNGAPINDPRLEYDRLAEQIQQSGHHRDLFALSPQANPLYDFMKGPYRTRFDIQAFVDETCSQGQINCSSQDRRLILIGHSAGGRFINNELSLIPAQKLRMVVFLDGINGPIELSQMKAYLQAQFDGHVEFLNSQPTKRVRKEYLLQIPHFFFYYSSKSPYYTNLHQKLSLFLSQLFDHGLQIHRNGAQWLQATKGHYRIISVENTIEHGDLARSGIIRRVLQTLPALRR